MSSSGTNVEEGGVSGNDGGDDDLVKVVDETTTAAPPQSILSPTTSRSRKKASKNKESKKSGKSDRSEKSERKNQSHENEVGGGGVGGGGNGNGNGGEEDRAVMFPGDPRKSVKLKKNLTMRYDLDEIKRIVAFDIWVEDKLAEVLGEDHGVELDFDDYYHAGDDDAKIALFDEKLKDAKDDSKREQFKKEFFDKAREVDSHVTTKTMEQATKSTSAPE